MDKDLRWRTVVWIILPLIFGVIFLTPSFVTNLPEWWGKAYLPQEKLKLGLDLRGGMQLSLGVKVEKAVENNLEYNVHALKEEFKKADIGFDKLESKNGDKIEIVIPDGLKKKDEIKKILDDYPTFDKDYSTENNLMTYTLTLKVVEANNIKDFAIRQALETIRNRIDEFGVSEPSIQMEGQDRILVQLPGIKNTQRAIDLIGKTAQLEFKLVDEGASEDKTPEGDQVLYGKELDSTTGRFERKAYTLKKQSVLTGDTLRDARVTFGEYNEPSVSITFDKEGAKVFKRITGENVGKRLAIILDDTVYSAPVIREKIPSGRAMINGHFTIEEAKDLAIALRAGALPAPVEILEERTVGPSLGLDSIKKGEIATLIGLFLVTFCMIVYYKWSGVAVFVCLLFDLLLMPAALAAFKATLTLPGIAGIALNLGMAVDSNVLVFERIREELKLGKTARASIKEGFSLAFWSIFDGNITTFFAGIILYQFGTGPLKGFAVTLMIGLITSSITNYYACHVLYDLLINKNIIDKRISI